eukprot:Platyproteum_vivax@DN3789_c0_g1_i1.p1
MMLAAQETNNTPKIPNCILIAESYRDKGNSAYNRFYRSGRPLDEEMLDLMRVALANYNKSVLYVKCLPGMSDYEVSLKMASTKQSAEDKDRTMEDKGYSLLAIVYRNMAQCCIRQKNYARAIEYGKKSLVYCGTNVKAIYNLALAYTLHKDVELGMEWILIYQNSPNPSRESLEKLFQEIKRVKKELIANFNE